MPDLGVDWPDPGSARCRHRRQRRSRRQRRASCPQSDQSSATDQADLEPEADEPAAAAAEEISANDAAELRYSVAIQGLETIGSGADLIATFDRQSVLRKGRNERGQRRPDRPPRPRRCRLLAELLRSQGYYDAAVEPRIERAGGALAVVLAAQPGALYQFPRSSCPGSSAAGDGGREAARGLRGQGRRPGDRRRT